MCMCMCGEQLAHWHFDTWLASEIIRVKNDSWLILSMYVAVLNEDIWLWLYNGDSVVCSSVTVVARA